MRAECQCGKLSADLPGPTTAIVACHCTDCQRRTGSPFGVVAYYATEQLNIQGEAKCFTRPTATGGAFENYFCPDCGTTVYVKSGKHPALIGIPIGVIADPSTPAPLRSVWEQSKYPWVDLPETSGHFPQGTTS